MGIAEPLEPTLLAIAARCLRVPPEALDPGAPLTRYGLDSLTAVELSVAISEATGVELTEDVLLDAPSINDLALHLLQLPDLFSSAPGREEWGEGGSVAPMRIERLRRMRADAALPADIDPQGVEAAHGEVALLTGATGFLGAHLIAALLAGSEAEIVCVVRSATDAEGCARVRATLRRYAVDVPAFDQRVRVLAGDICNRELGLHPRAYTALAREIGSIYHCAAEVNWALPYEALHAANVVATVAMLRLAATGVRKAMHFVSSVAACYSTRNIAPVREDGDATDPAGIHLGYGQSKWVAERLVEASRHRGLAATIYRPSLIAADSTSGIGNDDDFLALMLRGCIALGFAPEIDWRLDACPVDFVARSIAGVASASKGAEPVLHLRNPRHARWTEAVLWMNLRGYPVVLEPFETWIDRVERCSRAPSHPLYRLRGFLLNRPQGEGGRYLPQLYADPDIAQLAAERSDAKLERLGLECPRLGGAMLERTFDAWVARGVLPESARNNLPRRVPSRSIPDTAIETALQVHFAAPGLKVIASKRIDLGSEHSILGELTAWRAGSDLALHGRTVEAVHGDGQRVTLDLVLKPKPADSVVLEVTAEVAGLCDPALGAAFSAHGRDSELAGGDKREIAIYGAACGALKEHAPACLGVVEAAGVRALVLERIRDAELIDSVSSPASWSPVRIEAALSGIARIHAQWLGRELELPALLGRGRYPGRACADAAQAWWLALARHARPWLERWIGQSGANNQLRLAECGLAARAAMTAYPRTLIHNDFNPRNIALHRTAQGPSLCAFDWELATFGLPQRDLIELLCFVLPPNAALDTIERLVHFHRRTLERVSGVTVDSDQWVCGVRLALAQFGVERLPMYFIAHRFRPQRFLERVVRSWQRLANVCAVS